MRLSTDELTALQVCVLVYEEENGHVAGGLLSFIYGEKAAATRKTIHDAKAALLKLGHPLTVVPNTKRPPRIRRGRHE